MVMVIVISNTYASFYDIEPHFNGFQRSAPRQDAVAEAPILQDSGVI